MTPITAVEIEFADGVYCFDLKLPQIAELQTKCGVGIFGLYSRIMKGRGMIGDVPVAITWEAEAFDHDIFETIRQGLIGGGKAIVDDKVVEVSAIRASELVARYVHPAPLRGSWTLAAAILTARIEGYDAPKKDEPAERPARKRTASTSRKSSRIAPSSGPIGGN